MRIDDYSFRNGKEILLARVELYASLLAVVVNAQEAVCYRKRRNYQKSIKQELFAEGWNDASATEAHFEFRRDRVAVICQHYCDDRIYFDYLRFSVGYCTDKIDAGVLFVNAGSDFRRVRADLQWMRIAITVPIWVVALK